MLLGVLRRILARETAVWTHLAADHRPASIGAFATLMGRLLQEMCGPDRVLSQARRTVFVEAGRQPALGAEIGRVQQELRSWLAPLLAEWGSTDPRRDVGYLLALMDGLVDHQLARPAPTFDPATAMAALLRGLVDEGTLA